MFGMKTAQPFSRSPSSGPLGGLPGAVRVACLALTLVLIGAPTAMAQPGGDDGKATLELAADRDSYAPGSTARVAARVEIAPEWHVNGNQPTFDWLIPTELELDLPDGWGEPTIRYPDAELKSFSFLAEELLAVYENRVVIFVDLVVPEDATESSLALQGELHYQACDDSQCLAPTSTLASLNLVLGADGDEVNQHLFAAPGSASAVGGDASSSDRTERGSLAGYLLLGLLGGLILNVMPCVLPVLSLKIFGLVQSAGKGRSEVVFGSLATSLGILLSFWGLALGVIAAKAAGQAVGWGVQFQSPLFVTALLLMVVLFSLNLWGLFEIPMPKFLNRVGGGGRQGLAGHLVSGLFATLMATPCSAPFLGTALGFGLSQPAGAVLAIFTAIGLGMALPYLALAIFPGATRFLPKPGAWMDTVRKLMGFLLAGAAVWLLYVLAAQISSERLAFVEIGLLIIALFIWLGSQGRAPSTRRFATLAAGAVIAGTLWLGSSADTSARASTEIASARIPWVVFDQQEAESLAAGGQLVFVDVTADWCFTCKVNERLIVETDEIADAFERYGVVPMKADWTNRDPEISDLLEAHGRAGIPFYILYRPGAEPYVFGELLTKDAVLSALEESA